MAKLIVVTACDHRHDDLAVDWITSLRATPERDFAIGFIRLGDQPLPDVIASGADHIVWVPKERADLTWENGFDAAHLGVKARLPELIPGFDTYLWMDGDTWLQNALGLRQLAHAASLADIAAAPELDPNYWAWKVPDWRPVKLYMAIYGEAETRRWMVYPMINSGVFAARADSPLWSRWRDALTDSRQRQEGAADPMFSDQIPLHRLIVSGGLSIHPVRSLNNWLVCFACPMVDTSTQRLRTPGLPWEEINILHLAGRSKDESYPLPDSGNLSFRYSSIRAFFGQTAAVRR